MLFPCRAEPTSALPIRSSGKACCHGPKSRPVTTSPPYQRGSGRLCVRDLVLCPAGDGLPAGSVDCQECFVVSQPGRLVLSRAGRPHGQHARR